MSIKKKTAVAAGFAAAALLLSACGGSGGDGAAGGSSLRLALNQTEEHASFIALDHWGEFMEENSDGWSIDVYPNETLGAQAEVLQLVQDGSVDMAVVSGAQLENLNPDFTVYNLPKVFDDIEHQMQVINEPDELTQELFASLEDKNVTVVGGLTQGSRHVYTSFGEVQTPADLKGKKMRVQESKLNISIAEALGASATPMAYGELYTGLQSGVVDAAENNALSYFSQKHYEVAPYFSKTNHVVGLDYVIINTKKLEGMSDEDRQVFDDGWAATWDEHTELWDQATIDSEAGAEEGGATITEVSGDEFSKALEAIPEEYISNDNQQELWDNAREGQ